MKKFFSTGAVLITALGAMFLTACHDTNYYDATAALKSTIADYEANWVDTYGEIDEEQDWNMATKATATISITEDALSAYTLNLYTANPLTAESSYLLASYDVSTNLLGYAQVSFSVDIPDGTTSVFAGRKNASGKLLVQEVEVVDNTITAEFGSSSTAKGHMMTRSSSQYAIPTYSSDITTKSDVDDYLSDMQITYASTISATYIGASSSGIAGMEAGGKCAIVVESGTSWNMPYFYFDVTLDKFAVVIEDGATVTFTNSSSFPYCNGTTWPAVSFESKLIVESGGTLNTGSTGIAMGEATLYVLNGGVVEGGSTSTLSIGNSSLSTSMSSTDDAEYGLYNAGTITVDEIDLACTVLDNAGTITISGNIQNSAYVRIINNGKITCNSFGVGSNQDGEIWTNCSFICKEYCKGSNWRIGDYATISAEYVEVYSSLYLNYEAVLYGSTQVLIGNCDIYGPLAEGIHALCGGDDLYYFCNTDSGSWPSFIGNIIFAYDTMADGRSEKATWIAQVDTIYKVSREAGYCTHLITPLTDAINVTSDYDDCSAGISIDEDNIPETEDEDEDEGTTNENGGNEGTGETEEEEEEEEDEGTTNDDGGNEGTGDTDDDDDDDDVVTAMTWTVACEDLGSTDDYDFNDIVFKIEYVSGSTTATVTPLAAGGTYEAYLTYNGTVLASPSGYSELHTWLGAGSASTYYEDDVLRYDDVNADSYEYEAESLEVTVGSDFSLTDDMGGFNLIVYTYSDGVDAVTITAPKTGSVPQMFLVNGLWAWPKERVTIEDAYPNFTDWNSSVTATDWAEYQVSGKCAWDY